MEDWQRMTLYTESRLEDLRQEAALTRLAGKVRRRVNWFLVISAAVVLGLAIWLIL